MTEVGPATGGKSGRDEKVYDALNDPTIGNPSLTDASDILDAIERGEEVEL